jgi:hypothetical protein
MCPRPTKPILVAVVVGISHPPSIVADLILATSRFAGAGIGLDLIA